MSESHLPRVVWRISLMRVVLTAVIVVVVFVVIPQAPQDMADRVRDDHAQVHGPLRTAAAAPSGQGRSSPVPQHGSAAGARIPRGEWGLTLTLPVFTGVDTVCRKVLGLLSRQVVPITEG